jgi:hypothetical protein
MVAEVTPWGEERVSDDVIKRLLEFLNSFSEFERLTLTLRSDE